MTAQAQVIPINPEAELEQETLTLYEKAIGLVITDQVSFSAAGELVKGIVSLKKKIIDHYEPMRIKAKESYDLILKKKKDDLAPLEEAEAVGRKAMNVFAQEQERIRREAERKAQLEAEEQARKERAKLEAQAEKAIEKGQDEKADALLEKAEMVYAEPVTVAPVIDKTVRTASGNITQARELHITVTDIKAFVSALVSQNSAMTMIDVKAGPLKAWAKANAIKSFPGLQITETVGVRI